MLNRTLLILSICVGVASAEQTARWEWEGVPRIVAMGDVHANIDKLTAILQGTGVVDASLRWTGGDKHVVLCGDLTDRGPDDRAVLDLLRRLQAEAEAGGGRVHALLGNHDVMNLVRDFRFVAPESHADFAEEESSKDRRKAWDAFRESHKKKGVNNEQLKASFDERYPSGYFAREKAFGPKGEYGSWLLEQPAVVKVNGILFLHGGLTPEVAALGLDEINNRLHKGVRAAVELSDVVQRYVAGVPNYAKYLGTAKAIVEASERGRTRLPDDVVRAAEQLLRQTEGIPFSPSGPTWYRGNSLENERVERMRVDKVLELLNARTMMVGHTVTRTGFVSSRFNGRLIRGDVGMGYGRQPRAVVFEAQKVQAYDPVTNGYMAPLVEPPQGEGWARAYEHLPNEQIEKFLEEAEVTESRKVTRGEQHAELCEMKGNDLKMRAIFKDVEEGPATEERSNPARYQHEIAAYWLDQRLELDMVPVAIPRKHTETGKEGCLRVLLERATDLVSIKKMGNLEEASRDEIIQAVAMEFGVDEAELRHQVTEARVFDALIGNHDRQDEDKLFDASKSHVALTDHERAFSLSTEIDSESLLNPCDAVDGSLEHGLRSLDRDELQSNLGDYLSEAQIDALLTRRDKLIEMCSGTGE